MGESRTRKRRERKRFGSHEPYLNAHSLGLRLAMQTWPWLRLQQRRVMQCGMQTRHRSGLQFCSAH